jgi:urease accessory protein
MAMPIDQKATSFPQRRESTTECQADTESRRDPLLRGDGDARVDRAEGNGEAVPAPTLARLMTWLSPAFPVGGFSYSHGLEWTVEATGIRDAAALGDWVEDILAHGAGRSDVIFLAEAWRAVAGRDDKLLRETIELAAAFAPSAERRLETLAQGAAFLAAMQAVWPKPELESLCMRGCDAAYPVAVGASAAAHGLPLAATAQAFAQAFAANIVSAGVRLIPLGQTDGLRLLARLEPLIPHMVAGALACSLDDVDGAAVAADIASMRHETQYTRLFRS